MIYQNYHCHKDYQFRKINALVKIVDKYSDSCVDIIIERNISRVKGIQLILTFRIRQGQHFITSCKQICCM